MDSTFVLVYLAFMKQDKKVIVAVGLALHRRLKVAAARQGRPMADLVRDAITAMVEIDEDGRMAPREDRDVDEVLSRFVPEAGP